MASVAVVMPTMMVEELVGTSTAVAKVEVAM